MLSFTYVETSDIGTVFIEPPSFTTTPSVPARVVELPTAVPPSRRLSSVVVRVAPSRILSSVEFEVIPSRAPSS